MMDEEVRASMRECLSDGPLDLKKAGGDNLVDCVMGKGGCGGSTRDECVEKVTSEIDEDEFVTITKIGNDFRKIKLVLPT